ncbi:coiled-coil-helix-coiled-coil-helix domain-containing protein 7 [Pseudomyrmex gracilis]|uniref:coiled-coil-helix-coiled-coil-helix domain-containing protein 7 n=1 Tax=Pseudomyrmex gracilis TaxID=219809 RepID=UPI000994CD3E|nr:coiled-coil-helix-coiled-coil-helix domain-containing protein 7 [Pseudomyrmex gracilis]
MSARTSSSERDNRMIKRTSQREQEEINPCLKEHFLSLKCLESNQDKRDNCELYFLNYRNCREFWATVQSDRRSKGIKPYLPFPEERAKIKANYVDSK